MRCIEFGQAPETCPDAAVGAALQPDPAVPLQQQPDVLPSAAFETSQLDRVVALRTRRAGHTAGADGARPAQGIAQLAQRGPEIHQALAVGLDVALGQERFGQGPQFALMARLRQIAIKSERTRQHALDVPVKNRDPLAEAERRNRRCCRAADAGKPRQLGARRRKRGAPLLRDDAGAAVQIARAAVVAQTAPQAQHIVQRRCGQGGNIRKAQ